MWAENPESQEKKEFIKSDNFIKSLDEMFDDDNKLTGDEIKKLNELKSEYEGEKVDAKKVSRKKRWELTREMIVLAIKNLPEYQEYKTTFEELSSENKIKRQEELWFDLKDQIDGKFWPKTFFRMYQYWKIPWKITQKELGEIERYLLDQKMKPPFFPITWKDNIRETPQNIQDSPPLEIQGNYNWIPWIPPKIWSKDVYAILDHLKEIPLITEVINKASVEFWISVSHILSKASVESSWWLDKRKSKAWAIWFMQVMPDTLNFVRKQEDFKEAMKRNNIPRGWMAENIFAWTFYLSYLHKLHPDWTWDEINMAYNAWPWTIQKLKRQIMKIFPREEIILSSNFLLEKLPRETRWHQEKVREFYDRVFNNPELLAYLWFFPNNVGNNKTFWITKNKT